MPYDEKSRGDSEDLIVQVGPSLGIDLPSVGLGLPGHGEALSESETELITALRPGHLRAHLHLATPDWRSALDRAASTSRSTASALELALFLGPEPDAELAALAAALPLAQARVARIVALQDGQPAVDPAVGRAVKGALAAWAPGAPVADGATHDPLDAVVCPLSTTEPAAEGASVMEAARAHGDAVRSVQALCPGVPVVVGPVTFRAGTAQPSSLSGVGWTLASVASLAHAGASSVTYFETTGPSGVMERRGASGPGRVLPLYHVLADVQEWEYGQVGDSRSSAPQVLAVLCAHTLDGPRILLANLTPEARRCTVGPLPGAQVAVRALDESTADAAREDPRRFRNDYAKRRTREGSLELELAPFAFVRMNA